MDDPTQPSVEQLTQSVETGAYDDATASLRRFETASVDTRKAAVRTVRRLANERPVAVGKLLPALAPFLTDDDRSVRLTTSKLFVAVARESPSAVVPRIDDLAARLADEAEFYYVRARAAEALGYVAFDYPEEVASPALLADLRVGLSFDEPEVREKLAKALASLAIGDPDRLSHQTSNLGERLDDDNDLVRYHLCTALAVIGTAFPSALTSVTGPLAERLTDDCPYVRGRAAEALGVVVRAEPVAATLADSLSEGANEFEAERVQFVRAALAGDDPAPDRVASADAIRETTDEIATAVATPDSANDCPHCGLSLPDAGPPTCPGCGVPR